VWACRVIVLAWRPMAGNWQQRKLIRALQFLRSNLHTGHGRYNLTGCAPDSQRQTTRDHGNHDTGGCFTTGKLSFSDISP
jgi:hypothetical protein